MDETDQGFDDTLEVAEEDKTPEEDKTSEKNEPPVEDKPEKTEIIQKKYWRDKAKKLEEKLEKIKLSSEPQGDDAEIKAKEYIRNVSKEVLKEIEAEKKAEEEKILEKFEEAVEAAMGEYPDLTEKEIVDFCEKYAVEPKKAARILDEKRDSRKKPRMPAPLRGTAEIKTEEPPKEVKGDFYKLSQWLKKKYQ